MKPLSERDENLSETACSFWIPGTVGMKPLSERDENTVKPSTPYFKPRV